MGNNEKYPIELAGERVFNEIALFIRRLRVFLFETRKKEMDWYLELLAFVFLLIAFIIRIGSW